MAIRLIEEGKSLPIDLATALAVAGAKNLDILQAKVRLAEARGCALKRSVRFFRK